MNTNYTRPTFSAKKEEIRKADDIVRNARNVFPATSPTYMDAFFLTPKSKDISVAIEADKRIDKQDKKITAIRKYVKKTNQAPKNDIDRILDLEIFKRLRAIKILKVTNCFESSAIAMAALVANGIYDVERANVELSQKYINKKTGKVEFDENISLDHSVVLTKMNSDKKDYIVVDAWLGFADSESNSSAKYKQCLIDDSIREQIGINRSLFRLERTQKEGRLVDVDSEYDLKLSIAYNIKDKKSPTNAVVLGNYTRIIYPELCL